MKRTNQKAILAICAICLATATLWLGADSLRDKLAGEVAMYKVATGEFAPVYPALAKQILDDYGIREGICVDVGGGTGHLAMELARQSDLKVYNLDIDTKAIRLSGLLVDEQNLSGKVIPIEGDAQDMPFKDGFADLVVSRGSIPFWPDRARGVRECYRILKPGGVAYVGGGFSRILDPAVRNPIAEKRAAAFAKRPPEGFKPPTDLDQVARDAGIPPDQWRFIREPIIGWWLEIRKPAEE
jgi:SAM-dependent methyltransferase